MVRPISSIPKLIQELSRGINPHLSLFLYKGEDWKELIQYSEKTFRLSLWKSKSLEAQLIGLPSPDSLFVARPSHLIVLQNSLSCPSNDHSILYEGMCATLPAHSLLTPRGYWEHQKTNTVHLHLFTR
jgi:hypothetical protein